MKEPRRTAYAVVEVVLHVETDSWGPDCTMGQIVKQAQETARQKVLACYALGGDAANNRGIKLASIGAVRVRCEETP